MFARVKIFVLCGHGHSCYVLCVEKRENTKKKLNNFMHFITAFNQLLSLTFVIKSVTLFVFASAASNFQRCFISLKQI